MSHPESRPVFISYARDASRDHAVALYEALGGEAGGLCFLDTEDIEPGERFPERLVDALFDARVVVIFAEPLYFTRRYCLQEFHIATTPFSRVAERPSASDREKREAVRGIVLALPPQGTDPMLERFPPGVQGRAWPKVDEPDALAALVRAELATSPPTLRERLAAIGDTDTERALALSVVQLPIPQRIGRIPAVPTVGAPLTIGDAFVGRADDMWRIHDVLTSRRGGSLATAAGLTGALEAGGGFGKTRLAVEYMYRFGTRHFAGGLFWINAEQDAELQLYDVLRALDAGAPELSALRQVPGGVPAAVVRAIRAQADGAPPALFIVDNVPEPDIDQPVKPLDTWCPARGEVAVLATSRARVSLGSSGNIVPIPIETLDPDAAVLLLTAHTPREQLTREEWGEVATWVGHLPLALELLNALLRSGGLTPRALLAMSRDERPSEVLDRGLEALRGSVSAEALRGVTEAFAANYRRLAPEQQRAARLMAWLAPAPVPGFVIEAFGPEVFTSEVRIALKTRSFVSDVAGESGTYFGTMHRVLADFLRSQSPPEHPEVAHIASVLVGVVEFARGKGDNGRRLLRAVAPLVAAFSEHRIASCEEAGEFERAYEFTNTCGTTLSESGFPEFAGGIFHLLAQASARRLTKEHPITLSAMNNLAGTLRDRGDYAGAQALQERVLELRRRGVGDEHPDTLVYMNSLAETLRARGDYAGAQALHERVMEVMRRIFGDEHPNTLVSMNNLANTLSDRGDYAGAQALHERVLESRRRILGGEHLDTLNSLNNLANVLRVRGDYPSAQALQEQVLEARRRILGGEHPATLTAMNNLAVTFSERGEYASAETLQEQVLEAMRRSLGEEHPDTLAAMNNLASTLGDRGSHAGAQVLLERVLQSMRRTLGEEHPDTLSSANNLASTLRSRGDHAGAQRLQERVLEIRRRTLGDEHPDTLAAMSNLANTMALRGDYAAAYQLQKQVLEAMQRTYGEEHPNTLVLMNNLAETLRAQGNRAAAQELHERVYRSRLRILGEEHPATLGSMNNMVAMLRDSGDRTGARVLQERVLEAMRRTLGEEHPATLTGMLNLAAMRSDQEDWAGARELEEKVLEGRARVLGKLHTDTTRAAWHLLFTLAHSGNFHAANQLVAEHLAWLLNADEAALTADQIDIRDRLRKMLASAAEKQ